MASLDQLKQTFFEECGEALQQIESGLTDLREGGSSDDTINAVFRSVHSVKGGAGIFGFEDLVGFAHVFETVLDAMRAGKLAATNEIVDLLLSANDVLNDLITMSQGGEAVPSGFGGECRAALERLLGDETGGADGDDDGEPAPADFEGLDFTPVRVDDFEEGEEQGGEHTYRIVFRPKAEMLRKANEPLHIVRDLRKLGKLELVAESDGLPSLMDLEPDRPYIGWTGTLTTAAGREQIDEVFEFVASDCEIEIAEADGAADAGIGALPAVEPVAEAVDSVEPAAGVGPVAGVGAIPSVEPDLAPSIVPADVDAAVGPPADNLAPAPASPGPVAANPAPAVANAGPVAANPAPAAASPEPAPRAAPPKAVATTMRVELDKIDRVVNLVGELVIAQAMLGQVVHGLPEETSGRLTQVLDEVIHHTRELKDSVMSMRAQPIGAVFQRMPRLVRELAAKTGKKVKLEMQGETTEVDRSIIERLGDPLTHIIRNSIDHGIESPQVRAGAGKSEEGTIRLIAEHRGGRIVVEVVDDGGGVDPERVLKKARERGLVNPDAVLNEDEINNLIFAPGFSTAETISDISGRGVGMDVVRRNIQDVGGRISLKSERGRGMTLQLALPLTLAVMDGMVIRASDETYVVPMSAIVECLRPSSSEFRNLMGERAMLQLRGALVPLVRLCDLLDMGGQVLAADSDERVVIIADAGDGSRFGIIVDELCGHQQVVVKSMEESYGAVPGVAGATILGNGRVALILDVEKLSDLAASRQNSPTAARSVHAEPATAAAVN